MNTITDHILSRRSVRSFSDEQIRDEDLDLILKAATLAPNGMNQEPWHFTAIQDPKTLRKLDEKVAGPGESFFYHAPTLILVSIEIGNTFEKEDTACAMTNMMQAAHALGLGSVWCNRINHNPELGVQLSSYGVPEGYKVTGTLAVGYPKGDYPSPRVPKQGTITYIRS
ncbi:MAG: nitroreductase family protein [Sphaerochaetaceae bacterium]|nr:nitroreductase family protein [uncultured Sphaerochaeta sp.]MDC7229756.1 nitroreductase family protein [Sphaerochaetaceae bacterium]